MRIFDVTVPISELTPIQPGESRIQIDKLSRISLGDQENTSRIHVGTHTGTHVDAPFHADERGLTVDKLPLELLMGPAFVAEVEQVQGNAVDAFDLARLHFPKDTTRLLVKTRNSRLWENGFTEFERDYVYLAPQTAHWLVRRGIQLLGWDYLSIDPSGAKDLRAHQTLLGAGVVVVEGLDLSRVQPGPCHLVCLPLKLKDGDGAPARVLVIRN
jgi:arylformamidase